MSANESFTTRRAFLAGVGAVAAVTAEAAFPDGNQSRERSPAPAKGSVWSQEYWAQKGDLKLYLFRKRASPPQRRAAPAPILFLVHGSSISGRTSFDLTVPGRTDYSLMDVFAGYGFDVWTMDFEGYGRSSPTTSNSNIAEGVESLKIVSDFVLKETGGQRLHFFGESSGALRAGAFAMQHPDRVDRLVLGALTYTGAGSPTLSERAKQLDFFRANNRRPRDRAMIFSIFTRDKPGTTDITVAEATAAAELVHGDSVPTGTYLDMTANLPLVDPIRIKAPVMVVRGEFDGIATEEDLVSFFQKLPNGDRQLVVLPGTAHSLAVNVNRHLFWHAMKAFLSAPGRTDTIGKS